MKDSVLVIGLGTGGGSWLADADPLGWGGYVAIGAVRALAETGLHTMILGADDSNINGLDRLLANGPMGLIVPEIDIPGLDPYQWARQAAAAGVSTTVFGDELACKAFDRVVPDHDAGAYELTQWLLSRGKRHIRQYWTFASQPEWALARTRGYRRAMQEAGLQPLEAIVSIDATYAEDPQIAFKARSEAAAGALVPFVLGSKPTDAIMVVSDGSTASVISAIRLLGKKPNADVDVVGYDNYWQQASGRAYEPVGPIATVDKNNMEAGRELASLLLARRAGSLPAEPQIRLVKPTLRVF
jgi:DNA-binding LacI/PurR family transcriptional regulator